MTPQTWSISIDPEQAPAVHAAIEQGREIRLWHLLREPQERSQPLPCLPLLVLRQDQEILLPDDDLPLVANDCILLCAPHDCAERMTWAAFNTNALDYVVTGEERPDGYLWRWLASWQQAPACPIPDPPSKRGKADRLKS